MASLAVLDPENLCLFVPHQNQKASPMSANHEPSGLTTFEVDPTTADLRLVATVEDDAVQPSGIAFLRATDGQSHIYYTSFTREIRHRRVSRCVPGNPVGRPVRSSNSPKVPPTGLLRMLTIVR